MKIASGNDQFWNNREHFFAVAARAMRQILVDHARARLAEKRGGDPKKKELLESYAVAKQKSSQILDLDAALEKLNTVCERKAQVVELKFFGGFGISEIAKSLGVSDMTVKRDWRFARSWLLRERAWAAVRTPRSLAKASTIFLVHPKSFSSRSSATWKKS